LSVAEKLAPGAPPAAGFIPLTVPQLAGNEWAYVKECLDTGWVSSAGAFVERFERAVADAVGARYAVATVSGTAALHVALLVAGVQPGDEVLVSTLTFIAPANAIRYVGAWPVFIDAEPRHWQMDADKALDFLERHCIWRDGGLYNQATGRRVRAVLPVHILGHPADIAPLRDACRRYGLTMIEDATESLAATYKGTPVGAVGDIGCFSFNGNKLITTGGGGMLVTDDEALADRARYLTTQAKDDPVEYVHGAVGYNYRLTNVQAALGVAQMERLGEHVAAKRRIATAYNDAVAGIPGLTPMQEAPWARSVWWMYTALVDERQFGIDSRELMRRLERERIQTRPLWQPLHRSLPHAGSWATDCSVADRLNRDALSLPCSVGLTGAEQTRVIERVAGSRP
jgi:perosamine synthetase